MLRMQTPLRRCRCRGPGPSGSGQEQDWCPGGGRNSPEICRGRREATGRSKPYSHTHGSQEGGKPPQPLPTTCLPHHAGTGWEGALWGLFLLQGLQPSVSSLSLSLPSFRPVFIALIHALTPNALISPLICSLHRSFAYSSPNSFVLMCYLETPIGSLPTPRWKCYCCSRFGSSWMGATALTAPAVPLDVGEQIREASPVSGRAALRPSKQRSGASRQLPSLSHL